MKCALVTIHDQNYAQLADLTWARNRLLYATKQGYDAIAKTDGFDASMSIGFAKIALLLEIMERKEHEVLHWSGTDTMITNFHVPLTEFLYEGYHVTIATDFNGIQSDSFVIRNTMEGRAWLKMIMDKMPEYRKHPFLEQGVMMETHEQYQHIVKIVPQRFINSYHYPLYKHKGARNNHDKMGLSGQWQIGDFLIHAPDQPMSVRMDLFNQVLPLVIT
jgi:hypothetical protein